MPKNIINGIISASIAALLFLSMTNSALATEDQNLPMDKVNVLVSQKKFTDPTDPKAHPQSFKNGVISGRYMEDDIHGGCKDATLPKWESFL